VERYKNDKYVKAFAAHLKELRIVSGLTQEDLAGEANTSLSQVGRIERGERAPTILTVYLFAKVLGVHPKKLLDFETK
jgi:transcriptional regulator with XRE-family HTH domain